MIRRNVYVTVGSDEKVKFCESIGATKAINYKTQKWGEVVNGMNKPLSIH
jgi:NADPH2:quinone reductase